MFEKLKRWFMSLFNLYDVETVTGIGTCVSSEMKTAIDLWNSIFTHDAEWNEKYPSCGVLEAIYGGVIPCSRRRIRCYNRE